jgi:hypothetical protein
VPSAWNTRRPSGATSDHPSPLGRSRNPTFASDLVRERSDVRISNAPCVMATALIVSKSVGHARKRARNQTSEICKKSADSSGRDTPSLLIVRAPKVAEVGAQAGIS